MHLRDLVSDFDSIRSSWPAEPRVYPHAPDAFRGLLTMEEVDSYIDNNCIALRNLVMLRDGAVVEPYEYADGDMPLPGVVRSHLNEGQSISLRLLHQLRPSLAELVTEVREVTGCRTHVNAYLTPGHAQGLRYHYDPYVTLIVQLHGEKTWHLHPPFVDRPTEEHDNFRVRHWTDEERDLLRTQPPAQSILLRPGDVFWLPRGWVHSPVTTSAEPSLHLTFALKQRTRAWVVEQLTDLITRHACADYGAREVLTPQELLDGVEGLEWARRYMVAGLMSLDMDATRQTLGRRATEA